MTIKIEVEASNIDELADKLLALGGRLSGNAVSSAPTAETKEPAKRTTRKSTAATTATEASPDPVDTPESGSQTSGSGQTATSGASPSEEASATLDWDKDVAPKITGFVKSNGREFVAGVLEQFGVDRASQLPEERWGELLDALADAAEQDVS